MNITSSKLSSMTKDGIEMLSYMVLPENATAENPVAGILVAPEWWGVVEHPMTVTENLARLGFAVIAMDIYGEGRLTTDANQANEWMSQMLDNQAELMDRCQRIVTDFSDQPAVDANSLGVIGYCFGGKIALDMAREGMPLKTVATFHGNPTPKQPAEAGKFKAKVLVAHGEADAFIPMEAIEDLKLELDNADVDYTIDIYEGAKHGFTNPDADKRAEENGVELGYDESAAKVSWQAMVEFMQTNLV